MKTCLNGLIGRCNNGCRIDYDTNHHPNNYNCKDYHEVNLWTFIVEEKTDTKESEIKELEKMFCESDLIKV